MAFLVHQLVSLCPPVGLLVPVTRASVAHHVGIGRPCAGQLLPIVWGNSCPNIDFVFGQYSLGSLRCLNYLFAMFKLLFLVHRAVFNDTSIVFNDTSMILLSAFSEKSH